MISIIVPVHNSQPFLQACIQSVKAQTYSSFEAILIDDHSTDSSFSLLQELTLGDSRFRLLHAVGHGAAMARNEGINHAKGEYLCFLDSDDELLPTALQSLYDDVSSSGADLVIKGLNHIFSKSEVTISPLDNGIFVIDQQRDEFFRCLNLPATGSACAKLFKHSLISQYSLRFNSQVTLSEDLHFLLCYISIVTKVVLSTECIYWYFSRRFSYSTCYYPFEKELKSYLQLRQCWEQLLMLYPSEPLLLAYGQFSGSYINRLYYSALTYPKSQNSRDSDIRQLEHIADEPFRILYRPTSAFTNFLKYCIVNRRYYLYIFAVKCSFWRYSLNVSYKDS